MDLPIASISIETAEVGLEQQLSLSEADCVDGFELLFCEVIFFLFSDGHVTDRGGGSNSGDIMVSLVVVNDLLLLSILHAVMKGGFASFHDLHPKVIMEAGHEQLMLEELLHVFDAFFLHGGEVSNQNGRTNGGYSCRNDSDGVHGIGLGLAHLVEGLTYPQVVVLDALSRALHQFMKVCASHLGCVPRFVHSQKFCLDNVPDSTVDSCFWQ